MECHPATRHAPAPEDSLEGSALQHHVGTKRVADGELRRGATVGKGSGSSRGEGCTCSGDEEKGCKEEQLGRGERHVGCGQERYTRFVNAGCDFDAMFELL